MSRPRPPSSTGTTVPHGSARLPELPCILRTMSERKQEPIVTMVTQHMLNNSDGAAVELFQAQPNGAAPAGAMLFVHGYQNGLLLGAKEFADSGALSRFSSAL